MMRNLVRVLAVMMICLMLILPTASFVMAQDGDTSAQVEESSGGRNWGGLVFGLGLVAVVLVGMGMMNNQSGTQNK